MQSIRGTGGSYRCQPVTVWNLSCAFAVAAGALLLLGGCNRQEVSKPADDATNLVCQSADVSDSGSVGQSDLTIIVDTVEPAYARWHRTGEAYRATVRFRGESEFAVQLPFTEELAETESVLCTMVDFDVQSEGKWIDYWQPGMIAYIPYSLEDAVRVARGEWFTAKLMLPFESRNGDPLVARIRVGNAVSAPIVLHWAKDRAAGRFKEAMRTAQPAP